jgi:P2-related tail formation protein
MLIRYWCRDKNDEGAEYEEGAIEYKEYKGSVMVSEKTMNAINRQVEQAEWRHTNQGAKAKTFDDILTEKVAEFIKSHHNIEPEHIKITKIPVI